MLSCKELTRKIASEELAQAGWSERVAVRLHLLMCRRCRRYSAQLQAIGASVRELWGVGCEDPNTMERLESKILEHPAGDKGSSGDRRESPEGGLND